MTPDDLREIVASAVATVMQEMQNQPAEEPPPPPVEPPREYDNPDDFYREILAPIFAREWMPNGVHPWCAQWDQHREAWVVVAALWNSWELLRLDPVMGMAVWMRDYAYPLMTRLLDPTGTFCGCTAEKHKNVIAPLPPVTA
jgi:Domain of unknown function (DUF4913)